MFEGVVIARKGGSNRETFTVRKILLWNRRRTHFSTPFSHGGEDRRGAAWPCAASETLLLEEQEGRAARIRERRPS